MLVRQIHDPKLAQYAYLIGCPATGEAIVTGDFVFVGGVVPGARAIHVEVTGGPTPQWIEKARADDRRRARCARTDASPSSGHWVIRRSNRRSIVRSLTITKMLAPERATHRIRVTVVCPGAIETGIDDHAAKRGVEQAKGPVEFPAGRIPLTDGTPGTADAARHVTGTEVWIDGAQSLLVG